MTSTPTYQRLEQKPVDGCRSPRRSSAAQPELLHHAHVPSFSKRYFAGKAHNPNVLQGPIFPILAWLSLQQAKTFRPRASYEFTRTFQTLRPVPPPQPCGTNGPSTGPNDASPCTTFTQCRNLETLYYYETTTMRDRCTQMKPESYALSPVCRCFACFVCLLAAGLKKPLILRKPPR